MEGMGVGQIPDAPQSLRLVPMVLLFDSLCGLNLLVHEDADLYYKSREYESRIGAWASKQSSVLKNREELYQEIENYKKKYPDKNNVPRPSHWSGWILNPNEIEFWLDVENRIHQRLQYIKSQNGIWNRSLLSP